MSKKKKLLSLEPRILLDAAGIVSGADAHADSAEIAAEFEKSQQGSQQDLSSRLTAPSVLSPSSPGSPEEGGKANDSLNESWTLSDIAQDSIRGSDEKALIVVDTGIENYQSLLSELDSDAEVLLLDSGKDGLAQLRDYVSERQDISAIHILSHGGEGSLQLGTTLLDANNLGDYQAQLHQIGQSLALDGDILLYGCNVGAGTGDALAREYQCSSPA